MRLKLMQYMRIRLLAMVGVALGIGVLGGVVFAGLPALATNLVSDPGFEASGLGWQKTTNGGRSIVTMEAHSGTQSQQMDVSNQWPRLVYQDVPVTGDSSYDASVWIKTINIDANGATAELIWLDASGLPELFFVPASSVLRTDTIGSIGGTNSWSQVHNNGIVALAGAVVARFNLTLGPEDDGAGTAWFDDAGLIEVLPAPPLPSPLEDGLVSLWSGDVGASDDYYTNDGILRNGASSVPGRVGQAFAFDGVDDNVEVPFSPTLISPAFSVEAWVNPSSQVSNSTNQSVIFGQTSGALALVVRPGTLGLQVAWMFKSLPGPFVVLLSSSEIPIGSFSHIAGTWDGHMLRLYINGVLDAHLVPGQTPRLGNQCPFNVGGFGDSTGCSGNKQNFHGLIDELRLYDEAIEPARVLAHFQN